ncbi:MAG: tetratricopeptide repeat protein, partial [Desulfurivibrionaceae bacterium]
MPRLILVLAAAFWVLAGTAEAARADSYAGRPFNSVISAAESGDVEAQYYLARSYEEGAGVTKSIANAVKWYHQAATMGHVEAQYEFATALDGNPDAAFLIGKMYRDGVGVEKKLPAAVRLFEQAADLGHAEAQYVLGSLYATGSGVEQDNGETLRLWKKAAAQGHEKAKADLADKFDTVVAV